MKFDGGMETGVRQFVVFVSYLSFFFRVSQMSHLKIIVIIVFWKDSMDFNRIIKNQDDTAVSRSSHTTMNTAGPMVRGTQGGGSNRGGLSNFDMGRR
jgi:hypothetical protein